jgi:hypothetical protein
LRSISVYSSNRKGLTMRAAKGLKQSGESPRATLKEAQVLAICVATGCARGTVQRWAKGARVQPRTAKAITKECEKAGIEVRA